jgi:hypothetical protein
VIFDDPTDDCQPDPRAGIFDLVRPRKHVKDSFPVSGCDPETVISDGKKPDILFCGRRHVNFRRVLAAELD